MRKRCLDTVYELAKKNNNIVFIGSDLGIGTLDNFKKEMPERFFMEGISEQHLVGMAAGMAMNKKIVYFNTIATFITRRCFEQNIIDLGIAKANVRLIGNGGGLVYAPLGPTHLAFEDVTIMRAIPNMTIIAPCDADEMQRAVIASEHYDGPIYFRVAKGGDPLVSKKEHGFEIGKAIVHRKPGEVLLIAMGVMVERAIRVATSLNAKGIEVGVINVHTPKPLDQKTILEQMRHCKVVITLEEHTLMGGLGSAVAELVAEQKHQSHFKFKRMGLPDVFPDQYGSQNDLIKRYEMDVEAIEQNVLSLLEN